MVLLSSVNRVIACISSLVFAGAAVASSSSISSPPAIASLLKPAVYRAILDEREVQTHASLDDMKPAHESSAKDSSKVPGLKHYSFYAAMLVRAPKRLVRETMTNYPLYAKMIPYVDSANYNPAARTLRIEGGIWGFKLQSQVRFEEESESVLRYRIIGGHFQGLVGRMIFESAGEKGTLVFWDGEQNGTTWPPTLIVERGAEIVFGFTGKRMRSYIESLKDAQAPDPTHPARSNQMPKDGKNGLDPDKNSKLPEPRRRL